MDTPNPGRQSSALQSSTASRSETPAQRQNFKIVARDTGYLNMLFKADLTHFGGCTFSLCWRWGSSLVCQARHNRSVNHPLQTWQGWEQSSSYLLFPEKNCEMGLRNLMAATSQQERPQTCMGQKWGSRAIPREEQEKFTWIRHLLAWQRVNSQQTLICTGTWEDLWVKSVFARDCLCEVR